MVALVALALLAACREATQITVDVRLRGATCADMKTATISITRDDVAETSLAAFSTAACLGGEIGSLAAIPENGGDGGKVFVRVVVGFTRPAETCSVDNGYDGCTVARRRISYKAHTTLRLPVTIDRACENQPCTTRTTCNRDRICENADLDAACGSETCDLPSEARGTQSDASPARDAARDRDSSSVNDGGPATDAGGGSDGGGAGPNARWANAGFGVKCASARCNAAAPYCVVSGASATCSNAVTFSDLECDESSDCPGGSCCYSFGANSGRCNISACTEGELCWVDGTCAAGTACLNTISPMPYGDLGVCRAVVGSSTSVACARSQSCGLPDVCNLMSSGWHTCGPMIMSRYVACNSRLQCGSGACRLYPANGGFPQRASCGPPEGDTVELCDGAPNGCAGGRVCTTDVVEVGFGYFLRVCR